MTHPHRTALLVVGMHRSGTSALTGILGQMGADLPNDLMAASELNAKGFFESNRITQFDEDLLASAGFTWWDCRRFPAAWFTSPKAGEFARRAVEELAAEFGDSALFVLKDPRICRLTPFWLPVLKDNGCRPLIVHTHRHPRDVAASLEHRAGYDLDYGLLMWLRHVLDAEAETRGERRVFTSYERVMTDWSGEIARIGEGLNLSWPRTLSMVAPAIDDFLSRDLQHFTRKEGERASTATLPPLVSRAYEIIDAWAVEGERPSDRARLDKLRDKLDAATDSFGGLARRGQEWRYEARQYREAHHELAGNHARQQAELDAANQRIAQTDADLQQLRDEAAAAAQAAQAARAERDALQQAQAEEQGRLHGDLHRLEADLEAARAGLAAVEAAAATQAAQTAAERDALQRAQAEEQGRLQEELNRLEADLDAARAGLEAMEGLEAALHQTRSALIQREEEADQVRRSLDALEVRSQGLESALDLSRKGQGAAEHERDRVARQLARLTAQMTATMRRDLSARLARLEAEARAVRSEATSARPVPADPASAAEAATVADPAIEEWHAAVADVIATEPPLADAEAPAGAATTAGPAAAAPAAATEAGSARGEPQAAAAGTVAQAAGRPATAASPAEGLRPGGKRKRPSDGVKPPFRGLKRLWRKMRGRGAPRF